MLVRRGLGLLSGVHELVANYKNISLERMDVWVECKNTCPWLDDAVLGPDTSVKGFIRGEPPIDE